MIINNIEVDFKITRPADAEAFEKAMKLMQKEEDAIKEKYQKGTVTLAKTLSALIKEISNFFINATGQDVLDSVDDYEVAQDIYMDFITKVLAQQEVFKRPYSRLQIDSEV